MMAFEYHFKNMPLVTNEFPGGKKKAILYNKQQVALFSKGLQKRILIQMFVILFVRQMAQTASSLTKQTK